MIHLSIDSIQYIRCIRSHSYTVSRQKCIGIADEHVISTTHIWLYGSIASVWRLRVRIHALLYELAGGFFLYFHSHRRSSRQHMHTQTKQTQNYKLLFVRRFRDSVDSLPVQYTSLFDSKRILIYLFFVIFFHSLGEYFTQNSIFHSKSESRE